MSSARGARIPDALIEFGADGVQRFEPTLATRTLEDGTFAIYGCEDIGPFSVRATAEHFAPSIMTPDAWKPIVFVLDGGATLLVRTLDAVTLAPLSGARVTVLSGDPDPRDARTRLTYEGRSSADGIVTIEIPARYTFNVRVVEETHRTLELRRVRTKTDVTGGTFVGDVDSPVFAGERREWIAHLAAGESLEGAVVEKRDDNQFVPISNALVRLRHGERKSGEARTDKKGWYRFEGVYLADRSPVIEASAVGYYDAEQPLTGRVGKAANFGRFAVALSRTEPPISVGGRVIAADGAPVARAQVRVPERGLVTLSATDGTFSFGRIPRRPDPRQPTPLTLTIVVEKDQQRVTLLRPVPKLTDGDAIVLGDVTLVEVAEISGVVMRGRSSDRTQYPLVELIRTVGEDKPVVLDTTVGSEFGDYKFVGLEPGSYRVRARDASAGGGTWVLVERGRTIPSFVEVRVVDAKVWSGRVEDARGKPGAGIVVRPDVTPKSGELGDASLTEGALVTDEQGAFRFRVYGPAYASVSIEAEPNAPGRQTHHEHLREGEENVIRLKNYTAPFSR